MHFSKTYTQILLTLPADLRAHAICYYQLKKLIEQVVQELSVLGFTPTILHDLLEQSANMLQQTQQSCNHEETVALCVHSVASSIDAVPFIFAYELSGDLQHLEPRLRLSVSVMGPLALRDSFESLALLRSSRSQTQSPLSTPLSAYLCCAFHGQLNFFQLRDPDSAQELVIPLPCDTAFFEILINALESLSSHLHVVHSNFISTVNSLYISISQHARPMSSARSSNFRPYSQCANPGSVRMPPARAISKHNKVSDLYMWREIFRLYVENEVFETVDESHGGERSVADAERRLEQFMDIVHERGILGRNNFKEAGGQTDVEVFIRLIYFILDLKKFHQVNFEATRKILKKHSKKTALPLPECLSLQMTSTVGYLCTKLEDSSHIMKLIPNCSMSLPRLLIQSIGEILLPIIPQLDDYSCPICTSIAFKPIRLTCKHLFCVRCLVRMQRRGNNNCPMCRAPTVLSANRTNMDWAMLNFMRDWFPAESREKQKNNERETRIEQAREFGMSPICIVA